jgi:hypothetical protein
MLPKICSEKKAFKVEVFPGPGCAGKTPSDGKGQQRCGWIDHHTRDKIDAEVFEAGKKS